MLTGPEVERIPFFFGVVPTPIFDVIQPNIDFPNYLFWNRSSITENYYSPEYVCPPLPLLYVKP